MTLLQAIPILWAFEIELVGLKWVEYVWIMLNHWLHDESIRESVHTCATCEIPSTLWACRLRYRPFMTLWPACCLLYAMICRSNGKAATISSCSVLNVETCSCLSAIILDGISCRDLVAMIQNAFGKMSMFILLQADLEDLVLLQITWLWPTNWKSCIFSQFDELIITRNHWCELTLSHKAASIQYIHTSIGQDIFWSIH